MLITLVALALGELPVTDVTVFSDRARVTRSGALSVSGRQRLELATLTDSTDVSSVNVEATGAELETVELLPLEEDQLPITEARTLLKALEENADAAGKLGGELAAVQAQLSQLQSLKPEVPTNGTSAPPPRLSASGWSAALSFSADQLGKLQGKERELKDKLQDLADKRTELQAKANQLGGARRRTGWKIVATAKGTGATRFSVTYVALRARWIPTYDVQLQPDTGRVQVSFAGLVSQETGDDWTDAQLTLSTAIPSQANEFPKLLTWKIGQRDRFIPTPTPAVETVRPPPAAPPLYVAPKEEDQLRAQLTGRAAPQNAVAIDALTPEKRVAEADKRAMRDEALREAPLAGKRKADRAPQAQAAPSRSMGAPSAPPAAPPEEIAFSGAEMEVASTKDSRRIQTEDYGGQRSTPMSLSPPSGWARPSFSAELPAAAGGGYDLSWPSLQKETIQSGKGARRVALFSQSWPVKTERKLFPALFAESFLVAELKNPAAWPLPAGAANLYVGADPAGTARLELTSPGQTFTLPLGIDRALKPVRNVRVVDAEKGVFSKDDFSEYTVSIQLANPYRSSVAVRLYDQIPVTDSKDVEIALLESKPQAKLDKVRGHLEWRLEVPAGQKTEVSFKYTLKRPKSWRMNQWEVPQ